MRRAIPSTADVVARRHDALNDDTRRWRRFGADGVAAAVAGAISAAGAGAAAGSAAGSDSAGACVGRRFFRAPPPPPHRRDAGCAADPRSGDVSCASCAAASSSSSSSSRARFRGEGAGGSWPDAVISTASYSGLGDRMTHAKVRRMVLYKTRDDDDESLLPNDKRGVRTPVAK
jgi:hypothetical protein